MPPKIHDLANLCNLCSEQDQNFSVLLPQCSYLTQFGVQPRYPKELYITSANVDQAVKYSIEVKNFTIIIKLREEISMPPDTSAP